MKKQIRILGIDDSPFSFTDKYCRVVGVVMRGGEYLEGVLSSKVTVDGTEATSVCLDMIQNTRHRKQLKAIMIDGITFGGFNILNIEKLAEQSGLPIITVTRDEPDFRGIQTALQKNFEDWQDRWQLLQQGTLHKVPTKYNPIFVRTAGISLEPAEEIIKVSTIRGVIPEPIRVAHLIASGITRGESYGKA